MGGYAQLRERIAPRNRQIIKSEVGTRAIIELERWFPRQWEASRDFKEEPVALLDASKFGHAEYTPWQVYLKALYENLREDLQGEELLATRSAVELPQIQEGAVKRARRILARYDGVMIADSVGLVLNLWPQSAIGYAPEGYAWALGGLWLVQVAGLAWLWSGRQLFQNSGV